VWADHDHLPWDDEHPRKWRPGVVIILTLVALLTSGGIGYGIGVTTAPPQPCVVESGR
jgi:hypothetical protein